MQAHTTALTIVPKGGKVRQFALLIFKSTEAFAARSNDETDPYLGAWRAYHKALVEAGIFVGGNPLQGPETGTTVRLKEATSRLIGTNRNEIASAPCVIS